MRLSRQLSLRIEPDGTGFLFNSVTGAIHVLNETGTYIACCLSKALTESEITHALAREFDVEATVARRDVAAFLALLRKGGFLDE